MDELFYFDVRYFISDTPLLLSFQSHALGVQKKNYLYNYDTLKNNSIQTVQLQKIISSSLKKLMKS